ncbi:ER membrane protein complex subunit 6 [Geodia barretti]|uniref:ER membrane protein complex subunit 6 n=1 Tax=Geodia barretti TaxID=519541 RepID=A0AA35RNU6_GEOBA|nr:ER membrane protein complex subunit 6 [Geodia barretti]
MGGLKETVYNDSAIKRNAAIVDYCRTSGAVIGGATAGVLGLTGLYGFLFYFAYSVFLSVMLAVKAGRNSTKYFQSSSSVWFNGVLGGLFTYVLLWTFLYGMVHVY